MEEIIPEENNFWFKLVMFMTTILLFTVVMQNIPNRKSVESFENASFELKTNDDIYDNFYVSIYDSLVYSKKKNKFELTAIIASTKMNSKSNVLEIGCGTGHHAAEIAKHVNHVIAIDSSPHMITKCLKNYSAITNVDFKQQNAMNPYLFDYEIFDDIICLYFTIYYFKNKAEFLKNCYKWLKYKGYLVLHLVDRDRFDPVVPPASPFLFVNPQSVAKERLTKSSVVFENFRYNANFLPNNNNNVAIFSETFKSRDGNKTFRKNEHIFYMEPHTDVIDLAQNEGFVVTDKIDLIKATYEYQYLYVFQKQ